MAAISGLVFQANIKGSYAKLSGKLTPVIQQGVPGLTDNEWGGLTECACMPLNRSHPVGQGIRNAYETAVVNSIQTLGSFGPVSVVVAGSGGLLEEVCWLSEFYSKPNVADLVLNLVDTEYAKDKDLKSLTAFYRIAETFVRQGYGLAIKGWSSWDGFQTATRVHGLRHQLFIGMDTDTGTTDALKNQWSLQKGDIEKVLIVRWEGNQGAPIYIVDSRSGSSQDLTTKSLVNLAETVEYIKNAAVVGGLR